MLVNQAVQLTVLAAAMLWETRSEGAPAGSVKMCGRRLSDFMSSICQAHNSPPWDDPRVVEQPAAVVRRKRHIGIAAQCCYYGCTVSELMEYCAVSAPASSESPMESLEAHMIADRSAENGALGGNEAAVPPAVVGRQATAGVRREELIKNVVRAAPVVGTVSPLLTWGRTLNTDLPPIERDRYAYIAVYT